MPQKPSIKAKDNGVVLHLRVQPKSSRNQLIMGPSGKLRLAITAPPLDGKANKAVTLFIAKTFRVPKRCVQLLSGEKSRDKSVFIDDIDIETVSCVLNASNCTQPEGAHLERSEKLYPRSRKSHTQDQ